MQQVSRHQCLVYKGSPAPHLPRLSTLIRQKLNENHRCVYLNRPLMVAAMRAHLFAVGINVPQEELKGSLALSSDTGYLLNGRFDIDRMLRTLEDALDQALNDGYQGLWVSGDMDWEFGPEKDFSKLLDYEWQLEDFLQKRPALSGICQYHADTLPHDVLRQGLFTHQSVFVNETLSRLNPHYVERESFTAQSSHNADLDSMIGCLCAEQNEMGASPLQEQQCRACRPMN
jgi:hypothetical protein